MSISPDFGFVGAPLPGPDGYRRHGLWNQLRAPRQPGGIPEVVVNQPAAAGQYPSQARGRRRCESASRSHLESGWSRPCGGCSRSEGCPAHQSCGSRTGPDEGASSRGRGNALVPSDGGASAGDNRPGRCRASRRTHSTRKDSSLRESAMQSRFLRRLPAWT